MMIGRVFSHIATQLSHFDLTLKLALETGKEDLTLAGLQAIA